MRKSASISSPKPAWRSVNTATRAYIEAGVDPGQEVRNYLDVYPVVFVDRRAGHGLSAKLSPRNRGSRRMTSVLSQLMSSPLLVWAAEETGTTTEKFQYDLPKTFEQWLLLGGGRGGARGLHHLDVRPRYPVDALVLAGLADALAAGGRRGVGGDLLQSPHPQPGNCLSAFAGGDCAGQVAVHAGFPPRTAPTGTGTLPAGAEVSRADAMAKLMAETDLLKKLSETHQVKFFTFGQHLENRPAGSPSQERSDHPKETRRGSQAKTSGQQTESGREES